MGKVRRLLLRWRVAALKLSGSLEAPGLPATGLQVTFLASILETKQAAFQRLDQCCPCPGSQIGSSIL
jgi:hypothetical protein